MMLKKFYYCAAIVPIVLSFGCKQTSPVRKMFVDESLFSVIEIDLGDLKQNAISNISDIATEVEYIPLETRDDNLIGEIDKLIIVDDSCTVIYNL